MGLMRELMQPVAGVYDSFLIQDKSLHLQNHLYNLQYITKKTHFLYTMYEIKHIISLTLIPPISFTNDQHLFALVSPRE